MAQNKEKNLIWIDLEMTGLRSEQDVILEIASLVTDSELNIIAQGPELVIHQQEKYLQDMSPWVLNQHTQSGLLDAVKASSVTIEQAGQETLDFLCQHCLAGISPLCGNSVWQDRVFLTKFMPRVVSFLHYRMIDVTTVKELVRRWYPLSPQNVFKKQETHRALSDIKESIAELKYYRAHFFNQ